MALGVREAIPTDKPPEAVEAGLEEAQHQMAALEPRLQQAALCMEVVEVTETTEPLLLELMVQSVSFGPEQPAASHRLAQAISNQEQK